MIEANELRIGNLVYDNFDVSNPYVVTIFSLDDFIAISHGCNKYQPIPLTEEWLVKCGFVKDSKIEYLMGHINNTYTKSYLIIGTYDNVFSPCVRMYDRDDWAYYEEIGENIKYLHQLQNLYFALTGEELTINL